MGVKDKPTIINTVLHKLFCQLSQNWNGLGWSTVFFVPEACATMLDIGKEVRKMGN